MACRCRDLNLLSKNQHIYLIRQMNTLRIREIEPLDEGFDAGEPSILSESMKMLVEAGVQTRPRSARPFSSIQMTSKASAALRRGSLASA
jgi:hypothetical protein